MSTHTEGWKDTFTRVKCEIRDNRLSLVAAAMSYYALFSFIPALSALVFIYAWVSDPASISEHFAKVSQILPTELTDVLNSQLRNLSAKAHTTLGAGAIGSILVALWSASRGSKAIMEAMNIIYNQREGRGLLRLNLTALGLTLFGALMGILAIGVIVGIPAVTAFFRPGKTLEIVGTGASWVILLGLFSFFLSIVYRYAPDRNRARWRWVSRGAWSASLLWAVVSLLFSFYTSRFGNFNKTYGSLSAVIVMMTWFYLSSFVVLLGGEINAELEHQTEHLQ